MHTERAFDEAVAPWRRELVAHCYRMTGSLAEAEELVQETLLKAWQRRDGFRGEASVRRWLHAIATHTAIDALRQRKRRVLPPDLGGASPPSALAAAAADLRVRWIEPFPDALLPEAPPGPEAAVIQRETVTLAFVAALQGLSPRERAALLLFDVVGWTASEIADHLGTSVAAVTSALQRARAAVPALAERQAEAEEAERGRVERYLDAWERADLTALAAMLRDDAVLVMPPMSAWFRGRADVVAVFAVLLAGRGARARLVRANGRLGAALWAAGPDGAWSPVGVQVFDTALGQITGITAFVGDGWHARFGLDAAPPAVSAP